MNDEAQPSPLPDLLDECRPPRPPLVRALLLVGAGLCFLLGVVGWLVPVVTGIPFYVVGAILLGSASQGGARLVNRLDRRLPRRVRKALRRARARLPWGHDKPGADDPGADDPGKVDDTGGTDPARGEAGTGGHDDGRARESRTRPS